MKKSFSLGLAVCAVVCLNVGECARAGAVSDYPSGNVILRSYAEAGFSGGNPVFHLDYMSDTEVLSVAPVGGPHTTSAAASHIPPGVHGPNDMAEGASSIQATFQPGGVDVLNYHVSGAALSENAHNASGNPADGDIYVRSQVEWFVWFVPVPNKPVAGRLLLPALPAMPDGVTLTMTLSQHNCCPPTATYTAPHPGGSIEIWHGYGYTLMMELTVAAPFGGDLSDFDFNYPVAAIVVTPGDYNGDGKVDVADYVTWRKAEGQTGTGLSADGSGSTFGIPDSVVNHHDYNYWRANFGDMAGAGASQTAVPEPATFVLWFLVVAAHGCSRGGGLPLEWMLSRRQRLPCRLD